MRGWTDADVPSLPAGSETYIGDKDSAVPVKQACKIAKKAGTPLKIFPGKSHVSAMYAVKNNDPSVEIDVDACISDPQMPDWGSGKIQKDDPLVAQQQQQVKRLLKTPIQDKNNKNSISATNKEEEVSEMSAMGGGAVQVSASRKEDLIEEVLNYLLGKAGKSR